MAYEKIWTFCGQPTQWVEPGLAKPLHREVWFHLPRLPPASAVKDFVHHVYVVTVKLASR